MVFVTGDIEKNHIRKPMKKLKNAGFRFFWIKKWMPNPINKIIKNPGGSKKAVSIFSKANIYEPPNMI
jgi:hypothetical protein